MGVNEGEGVGVGVGVGVGDGVGVGVGCAGRHKSIADDGSNDSAVGAAQNFPFCYSSQLFDCFV